MNWNAIGAIGEIVGALAVVVSVLYLSIQIRTNTRSQRSTMQHSLHQETVSRMMAIAQDDVLAEKLLKADQSYDDLTIVEKTQIESFVRAVFRGFENMFLQHQRGFFDAENIAGMDEAIRRNVRPAYFERWWMRNRALFHADFQRKVEDLMRNAT